MQRGKSAAKSSRHRFKSVPPAGYGLLVVELVANGRATGVADVEELLVELLLLLVVLDLRRRWLLRRNDYRLALLLPLPILQVLLLLLQVGLAFLPCVPGCRCTTLLLWGTLQLDELWLFLVLF